MTRLATKSAPQVRFEGDELRVTWQAFDAGPGYDLFKRVKRLPEYRIELDSDGLACGVSAPARFAPILGIEPQENDRGWLPFPDFLFDDQAHIVRTALAAKRFACWADCGLGKTLNMIEFARQVTNKTGGRFLIVTINEMVDDFLAEARKFYGGALPVVRLNSRQEMKRWCAGSDIRQIRQGEDDEPERDRSGDRSAQDGPRDAGSSGGACNEQSRVGEQKSGCTSSNISHEGTSYPDARSPGRVGAGRSPVLIAVTNYEKFNHEGEHDQVVSELRQLAGIGLDESDRLRTGGGKQKWALIKSARGIEFKLSCTATPAPNEVMEFASQASFLEKMRSENDILWTYFTRDPKTHRWTVKPHARSAFFEFMSSWSIYVRDPRRYGWRKDVPRPPDPVLLVHEIPMTPAQQAFVHEQNFNAARTGNRTKATAQAGETGSLFAEDLNAIASLKFAEAAKGFYYVGTGEGRVRRIDSDKPRQVATIAVGDIRAGLQILIWTTFDAETAIIAEQIEGLLCQSCPSPAPQIDILTGKTPGKKRPEIIRRFIEGQSACLVTRPSMLGRGKNFQNCGSMIFSGWTFSYVEFYQAMRRAWRHGQTRNLRVHIPIIRELEGQMYDAVCRKDDQHERAVEEMEANYLTAMARTCGAERAGSR